MGSIDDAIAARDVPALVRTTVRAMRAEAEGQFCRCENPDLTGRKSYLCFACELPNIERKREIEAAMASPHPFEPMERAHRLLIDICCDFCAHPRKHRVHQERVGRCAMASERDDDEDIQVTIHGTYGQGPMPVEFRDALVELVRLVKRGIDDGTIGRRGRTGDGRDATND